MDSRARDLASDSQGSAQRTVSHGRGGAGNFGKDQPPKSGSQNLETPTIKSDIYTTGRGGSGNMAKNDPSHPEIARAAQDVEGHAPREHEGGFHVGRGGAANVYVPAEEEAKAAKESNARKSQEMHRDKGLVEKGKEMLDKVKK